MTNGGNGGQPTPVVSSAVRDRAVLTVTGSVAGIDGYSGPPFTIQVFSNPASGGGGNVQGRKLIGTIDAATNDFVAQFPWTVTTPGSLITVVATPGDRNTEHLAIFRRGGTRAVKRQVSEITSGPPLVEGGPDQCGRYRIRTV